MVVEQSGGLTGDYFLEKYSPSAQTQVQPNFRALGLPDVRTAICEKSHGRTPGNKEKIVLLLTIIVHDRVVVLRKHNLPILEWLHRSLWHRRNTRLGFENISQVAMVSVDAHSCPQQILQAVKGDAQWRTSPCPRSLKAAASHERCRSETQVAYGSFSPPRRQLQAQSLGLK